MVHIKKKKKIEHLIWYFYHSNKALVSKYGRNLEGKASNTGFDLIYIVNKYSPL